MSCMEHPLRQACDCRWPRWATGGLKASLNLLRLLFAPISFQPLQEFLVVPAMRSLWPPPGWTTPSSLLWWGGASLSAQPCVGSILLKCLGRRGWAQPPGTAAPDLAPALAPSSPGQHPTGISNPRGKSIFPLLVQRQYLRQTSNWPGSGHMLIPEPVTVLE